MTHPPILQVKDLSVSLHKRREHYPIVESLSFDLHKGKTLALIGESGSGKSVTAQALMQLLPSPLFSTSGEILFHGKDLLKAPRGILRSIFGTKISMIFQNPHSSLNPVFTIEQQFQELIRTHLHLPTKEGKNKIIQALTDTGFHNPELCLKLYPHQLSGGMLQRVSIAMALLTSPEILIADEPTTALDVSVQYQILQLLKGLQEKLGMALLIITHNMGVVAETADNVLVLYAGRLAECAPVKDIFHNPCHPYTQDLLASRPSLQSETFTTIPGQPPHYSALPSGCCYYPRCSKAFGKCKVESPEAQHVTKGHKVRCWLYE
ncbi:oligopeptide/dipeptide ABC transporter, ATP-binding, C-terminal domain protein [Chlamydia psittaci WC]|uniref:Oligopeptide/dipeptide ABC transporter, ATP-binding, C-terminal domain protein n=1 Tax=Chlamydia psittaci 99DC5 TaxID=1112251 RepID=A0ABN0MPA6_CHLPS|nr:ABC transporter ATP-binding protein [Chlamydia psittaci]AFS22247.1 oligopeptide/dipeptide ABC transporter, ATP-binding, C-terminal domain protein [Chlamydia psittaci VS225]AFS25853.1 oligopeptide/dipeptide ABC transporter, ATP-binding, C-terminal domain protein [Chlamydia psittaci WC]AGE74634.1 putative peptide ABC transport ATP-binding protein [Chlamydia psittaci Mat116]EPJ28070.1 oligopeptide/dipeptide ABC transporter, ATP-binding, C-terminal domain protein [Chlamydia psittaci 99DC5]